MDRKKVIAYVVGGLFALAFCYKLYNTLVAPKPKAPFTTVHATQQTIAQVISATGGLHVKDGIKIGSLVAGTVKKIHVEENQKVKKGQLLAEIDDGKEDSEVREAKGSLDNTQAELVYQEAFYQRQAALYRTGQISKDAFQKEQRDLESKQAAVVTAQGTLDKATIVFNNKQIIAPDDGTLISIGIAKGERVTTDLDATVLFEIAPDLTKMEAKIDIDETDVGQIKENQEIEITVDTYPGKLFSSTIHSVSYAANGDKKKEKEQPKAFKAIAYFNNLRQLLRPGMTAKAKIKVAQAQGVLALKSNLFYHSPVIIKVIAKQLGYEFKPIDKAVKAERAKQLEDEHIEYVWVVTGKSFVEKEVLLGITDDIHFEIKEGVTASDALLDDVEESDEMEKLYAKMFGRGL